MLPNRSEKINYEDEYYNEIKDDLEEDQYLKEVKEERKKDLWRSGRVGSYKYTAKVHGVNSKLGIDGGNVSKLTILNEDGDTCVNYDRGWNIKPVTKSDKEVTNLILDEYELENVLDLKGEDEQSLEFYRESGKLLKKCFKDIAKEFLKIWR